MLPQVQASQNGTNPRESFKKDARHLLKDWREDEFRDNEFLRAYMVPVIADLGALVVKHAGRMAADSD